MLYITEIYEEQIDVSAYKQFFIGEINYHATLPYKPVSNYNVHV